MKCPNCGSELINGASFCTVCGKKITNEADWHSQKQFEQTNNVKQESSNLVSASEPIKETKQTKVLLTCEYCGRYYEVDPENPPLICKACGAKLPKPKTEAQIAEEKRKALEDERKKKEEERKREEIKLKLIEEERREAERKKREEQERILAEIEADKKRKKAKRRKGCLLAIIIFLIIVFGGGYLYNQRQIGNLKIQVPGFRTATPVPTRTVKKSITATNTNVITETPTEILTDTPAIGADGRILRPTDTRWPTLTPKPTDTRWPTNTPRPTDTLRPTLTPIPTNTPWPVTQPKSSTGLTNNVDSNGVDRDLKEFLDSYEDYVDQYIKFMKSYDSNDLFMLVEYLSFVDKLANLEQKSEQWESNKSQMSSADYSYYITVMTRINNKLLQASY